MIAAARTSSRSISSSAVPRYEVRQRYLVSGATELSIWQMPSPATPALKSPHRMATLYGRNLELVEHRILRRLVKVGVRLASRAARRATVGSDLDEHSALVLALLFRTLAPMRNRLKMREVAEGIEAMPREEAAYWLGMAVHRPHPRRVLSALRVLLTDPSRAR
jgi:hypothetical protein